MMALVYVALGGALGSVARFGMTGLATRLLGSNFPYGTLAVNLLGGFLMGVLAALLARQPGGYESLRLFLAIGVLGGFTTFSAFSLDVMTLYLRGEVWMPLVYIMASVTLSVMALALGLYSARLLEVS